MSTAGMTVGMEEVKDMTGGAIMIANIGMMIAVREDEGLFPQRQRDEGRSSNE